MLSAGITTGSEQRVEYRQSLVDGSSSVDLNSTAVPIAGMVGSAIGSICNMAGAIDTACTEASIQEANYASQGRIADSKKNVALKIADMEGKTLATKTELAAIKNNASLELQEAQSEKAVVKAALAEQKALAKDTKLARREYSYGTTC